MAKSKYYKGMLLKHKKYGFVIRLLEKHRFSRWVFEMVKGEMPKHFRPETIFDTNLDTYPVYSSCTIRMSFEPLTDSKMGRLLYEEKQNI
jgi:hypothetical protein